MNTSCRGATSIGEHKAGSSHAQDNDAVNCSIAERINKIVNGALFIFDIKEEKEKRGDDDDDS
jgi:hypothetical protein